LEREDLWLALAVEPFHLAAIVDSAGKFIYSEFKRFLIWFSTDDIQNSK
jgi:hypothetical protein